ncbi:MAG TPA: hypothetical protein VGN55_20650, partial [Xanthobacteraceae bacterium]
TAHSYQLPTPSSNLPLRPNIYATTAIKRALARHGSIKACQDAGSDIGRLIGEGGRWRREAS